MCICVRVCTNIMYLPLSFICDQGLRMCTDVLMKSIESLIVLLFLRV